MGATNSKGYERAIEKQKGEARKKYMKEYRQEHKERVKEYQKEYRQRPGIKDKMKKYHMDRDQRPGVRAKRYAKRWGCDYESALEWMKIGKQNRECYFCGEIGEATVLHHDHATLKILGWSDMQCNVMEGILNSMSGFRAKHCIGRMIELYYD